MKACYLFIFIVGIIMLVVIGGMLLGRFNIGAGAEITLYVCAICTAALLTITALLFMEVIGK